MKCARCGEYATRDMVDVGVGDMPASDWGCERCLWVEDEPPTQTVRWWVEPDKVTYAYKATTDWERRTLMANGFKMDADKRPMVYTSRAVLARYLCETIQRGGVA